MPLSIYQLSIPAFLRGLAIAGEYCRKASAFCIEREISPSTLIDARLAPDMLPFAGQIQRISDTSKRPAARLAAIEPPAYEDAERTFPELQARTREDIRVLEIDKSSATRWRAITRDRSPGSRRVAWSTCLQKRICSPGRSQISTFISLQHTTFYGTWACQSGSEIISFYLAKLAVSVRDASRQHESA